MKIDILVPASGESVKEGDIARWFKVSGDRVEMDEPLLELETDKASLEITAETDGILTITEGEGKTVKVGQSIGYLTPVSENKAAAKPAGKKSATTPPQPVKADRRTHYGNGTSKDLAQSSTILNHEMPSPAARKLMAEHHISSKEIKGTGKEGRITKADVLTFLEEREKQQAVVSSRQKFIDLYGADAPVISPDETITLMRRPIPADTALDGSLPSETSAVEKSRKPASREDTPAAEQVSLTGARRSVRRDPMSRLRKTIAKRLVVAQQTAALLTTFNEVDMSAIIDIRKSYKEKFQEAHKVNLGFLSFFAAATCHALREFPKINSQIDGEDILYFDYCDIGIAVATPKGLVVPVIRNAETLALHEIEREIATLATKGKNGDLTVDDLSGGTFSITNGGVFGSMLSTPIVNHPQSAILGMHKIVERPVVRKGEIVIRPMMNVALTYDHRLIDGAEAVRFLVRIKESCEDPVKLLLDL